MAKKTLFFFTVKARIPDNLNSKLLNYCEKKKTDNSKVIRDALKKFLHNTPTKRHTIEV